jgi:hypothetical protein
MYRVSLTACTAGNPHQAWRGTTGEDDTEHVPNDVWEDVAFDFADLDAAKAYVASLDPDMTTHVEISEVGGEVFFMQDADADHLDDAAPDVVMPHTIDAGGPVDDSVIPEEPPPFEPPSSDVAEEVPVSEIPVDALPVEEAPEVTP